jgi:hypothetical protein
VRGYPTLNKAPGPVDITKLGAAHLDAGFG